MSATPTSGVVEVPAPHDQSPIVPYDVRRSSALCSETLSVMLPLGTVYSVSPPKYQSKSGPTSPFSLAIKPSSDVENPVPTFPTFFTPFSKRFILVEKLL